MVWPQPTCIGVTTAHNIFLLGSSNSPAQTSHYKIKGAGCYVLDTYSSFQVQGRCQMPRVLCVSWFLGNMPSCMVLLVPYKDMWNDQKVPRIRLNFLSSGRQLSASCSHLGFNFRRSKKPHFFFADTLIISSV